MQKFPVTPPCNRCGRRYPIIEDGSGMPIMVSVNTAKGSKINICRYCLLELGKMKESGNLDEFYTKLFEEEGKDV